MQLAAHHCWPAGCLAAIWKRDPSKLTSQSCTLFHAILAATYIHQGVPSLPEVTVRNHADRLTQLRLDTRWHRYHQADQLLLDGRNLLLLQLVISILIRPVSFNKVLKAQSACQASIVGERSGRCNMEKLQRIAWFFLFLAKSKFGYKQSAGRSSKRLAPHTHLACSV